MNNIDKRAVECCMTHFPSHDTADAESMRIGYIKGATEQRDIDIEKAVEWLKENARNYIFREESGKGIWKYNYVFIDANLYDDFKRAMLNENKE